MTETNRPKKKVVLDEYEKEIEEKLGSGKPLSDEDKLHYLEYLTKAATAYTKKDKRISVRVFSADLDKLKMIALNEGLPYQTLITSILHKYATGQLKRTDHI